jgi:hypothetical protein
MFLMGITTHAQGASSMNWAEALVLVAFFAAIAAIAIVNR